MNFWNKMTFSSKFRRTEIRLKKINPWISTRSLSRQKPNFICSSGGQELPWDSVTVSFFIVFKEINLTLRDSEIIFRTWNNMQFATGETWKAAVDSIKEEGAKHIVESHNVLFRNPETIAATKACLFARLQNALLDRIEPKKYTLTVAYWLGAWEKFLFDGPDPDSFSKNAIVRHNALRTAIQFTLIGPLINKRYGLQDYKPFEHGWIRVRESIINMIGIMDQCDLYYQTTCAQYLIKQINFLLVVNFMLSMPVLLGLDQETQFNMCLARVGKDNFIRYCLEMYEKEGDPWVNNYLVVKDLSKDATQRKWTEGAESNGSVTDYAESDSEDETDSDSEFGSD
uniref:Uncharacterized protein n=1 Tax=Lobelia fenshamii TaxID=2010899 RepID=A0A1Z2R306_9ASTR|nr:hypothetical protein Lo_spn1Pt0326 [Lobelia fenshamii]